MRRFPKPWNIEELEACFKITDATGFAVAYVYFNAKPGVGYHSHLMDKEEALKIASAKLNWPASDKPPEQMVREMIYGEDLSDLERMQRRVASLAGTPTPATYGQMIVWSLPCGSKMKVSISGCDSREEAEEKAWKMADEAGWKPARWWQYWRWGDTKRGA